MILCFIVLSSFCILLYTCANVICIKFLLTYVLTYLLTYLFRSLYFGYTILASRCVVWRLVQETDVNDRSDLQNGVNGATAFNEPRLRFTETLAPEYAAPYSELETVAPTYTELEFPSRDLPPVPVSDHTGATNIHGNSDELSSEQQSGSVISSAPRIYDRLANPDYYNVQSADNAVQGGEYLQSDSGNSSNTNPSAEVATSYCGLAPSTRDPPSVYDKPTKRDYYNIRNADNNGVQSGEYLQSDSGISLDISPSPPVATSYSGLESATREPPPAPSV